MVNVAILGYGTVGNGTAQVLTGNLENLEKRLGQRININYILDLREFPDDPLGDRVIHDFKIIENDPDVSIVAEMLGGAHPAYDFSAAALRAGKSVVTSNKEVVEKFGDELLRLAEENHVRYRFEASVGGGIPVISPLMHSIVTSNKVTEINAILNGTTNYILSRMGKENIDYETALKDAQKLGYAEANPSADVDGFDACRKICILAAIAFGKLIPMEKVKTRGIRDITPEHIKSAERNGSRIRLIGRAVLLDSGKIHLEVAPYAVKNENPLSGVDDVFNAILIHGNYSDDIMLYGKGAGKFPTASAVVSDIADIIARGNSFAPDEALNFSRAPEAYEEKLPEKLIKETAAVLGNPVFES